VLNHQSVQQQMHSSCPLPGIWCAAHNALIRTVLNLRGDFPLEITVVIWDADLAYKTSWCDFALMFQHSAQPSKRAAADALLVPASRN
jgi:hypothetical protein